MEALIQTRQIIGEAKPQARPDVEIRRSDVVSMRCEVDGRVWPAVEFLAKFLNYRPEPCTSARAINIGHRKVDQARVAVIMMRVKRQRLRKEKDFGWNRIDRLVVVEVQH